MRRTARLALAVPLAAALLPLATPSSSASPRAHHRPHCTAGWLQVTAGNPEGDPNPKGGSVPDTTTPVRRASWTLYAGSRPVAKGSTNAVNGYFSACSRAANSKITKIRFRANAMNRWRVLDPSVKARKAFTFDVPVTGHWLGTVQPPAEQAYGWRLLDNINLLWNTLHPGFNPAGKTCWLANEKHCWTISYTTDTKDAGNAYFALSTNKDVVMGKDSAISKHISIHESGHALMWLLYGRSFPEVTGCGDHYINVASTKSCAWTEGFADAVANYVLHDRRFVWGDGYSYDYSTEPTWDEGDITQGRVSQSLLDLFVHDFSWKGTLRELVRSKPADFEQYYRKRPSNHLRNDAWTAHILKAHTIGY